RKTLRGPAPMPSVPCARTISHPEARRKDLAALRVFSWSLSWPWKPSNTVTANQLPATICHGCTALTAQPALYRLREGLKRCFLRRQLSKALWKGVGNQKELRQLSWPWRQVSPEPSGASRSQAPRVLRGNRVFHWPSKIRNR